tara:strand:- start:4957 stop:5334 length:378 start_codon:yes stop_codon:yes gene_type:complete
MKLVYLPDFRKEFSQTEHVLDLRNSVGITVEDLLEHLIQDFPGVDATGDEDFHDVALGVVVEKVLQKTDKIDFDIEALICLVQEALEEMHAPFRRLMAAKPPRETWMVARFVPGAIVVFRRKNVL